MGCSASRFDTLIAKAIENSLSTSTSTSSNTTNNSSVVPKTRSLSTPFVHHPALKKGDTNHLVCLTSTTYGSLTNVDKNDCSFVKNDDVSESYVSLDRARKDSIVNDGNSECSFAGNDGFLESYMSLGRKEKKTSPASVFKVGNSECSFAGNDGFSESYMGLGRPHTEKEEKTSPDSVINAWELMKGLEDDENDVGVHKNYHGNDFKVKSLNLSDFNDDEMLHLVDDSRDFKVESMNLCDFNDTPKLPVSKLGMNLIDCSSDFKVKSLNFCNLYDSPKLAVSKLGRNLVDHGGDFKVKTSNVCDFIDAKTMPNSRSGLNLVDTSSDFKVRSSSLCQFEDTQTMPALKSGLNLTDSLTKLSDSYVFVEIPSEIVEEDVGFEMSPDTKPLWKHLSEESLLSKMDPYVGNAYERALSGQKSGYDQSRTGCKSMGSSPYFSKSMNVGFASPVVSKLPSDDNDGRVPRNDDRIVLYFTSLRSIRKTYEDCSTVRMILKGFRVVVDERDISMDSSFRKELQSALVGKAMSLPQLFIRGKHIGGADDVKLLHETGELESILEGCPTKDCGSVCRICGDARFVPCSNCYGSRKIFQEEEGQTRKCPDCNENGLVRCPDCCP